MSKPITSRGPAARIFRLGEVVRRPVYGPGAEGPPELLLAAGQRITSRLQLDRLREAGFAVRLPDAGEPGGARPRAAGGPRLSRGEAERPARERPASFQERLSAAQAVRRTLAGAVRSLQARLCGGGTPEPRELETAASSLVELVVQDPYAAASLACLRRCDDYTVEHSADVAILMTGVARLLGYAEADLKLAALAGLLHDVGKQRLPQEVLHKPGALTRDELGLIRRHPEYGVELLAPLDSPEPVRRVTLQHHERLDGSGYPFGLRGGLEPLSLIAAVADCFDAMTADRVYRQGRPPREALADLYAGRGRLYDREAVAGLIRLVGVYPVGTRVLLESGERATVVAANPADSCRPVVRIDRDCLGRTLAAPVILALGEGGPAVVGAE